MTDVSEVAVGLDVSMQPDWHTPPYLQDETSARRRTRKKRRSSHDSEADKPRVSNWRKTRLMTVMRKKLRELVFVAAGQYWWWTAAEALPVQDEESCHA